MRLLDKKSAFYKLYLSNRYSLVALCICIFGLSVYLARIVNDLTNYSTQSINITRDIEKSIGNIMLFDDILTMSARQFVSTNDPQWIEKYDVYDKYLDAELAHIKTKYPQIISTNGADETELANEILVNLEHQAIQLAKEHKNKQALNLLDSKTYLENKKTYAQGMTKFNQDLEEIINEKLLFLEKEKKYYYLFC